MGRKKQPRLPCVVAGCGRLIQRRNYCIRHYRERVLPRCKARGCGRNASHFGYCHPHWKNGGKPLKRRPHRPRAQEPRVLAWGRIHIVPSAVGVVEAEARRRQLTPSGVVAELVEAWAQAQLGPPAAASETAPGCREGHGAYRAGPHPTGLASGLEDAMALAARVPARGREGLRLGMLRLPAETAQRLNLVAQELGIASSEVIRRAVEVSLSRGF